MSEKDVASGPGQSVAIVLGLLGAAVGGVVGYFAFFWIARQGLYALVLPPGLLGLGAWVGARRPSVPLACICGVAGLALGLYTEWRFEPFIVDGSFGYLLSHVQAMRPFTLLSLALGTFLSYRFALGPNRKSGPA